MFYWFKACPGVYYIYDRPHDPAAPCGRQSLGFVKRVSGGSYWIKDLRGDDPPVTVSRWTAMGAVMALQRHVGVPSDVFVRENF